MNLENVHKSKTNITITVFINEENEKKRWFVSFFDTDQLSQHGKYRYRYEWFDFEEHPHRLERHAKRKKYCAVVGLQDVVYSMRDERAPHCYAIAVNDEFCNSTLSNHRHYPKMEATTQGRFYYDQNTNSSHQQAYLPLGPRLDFWEAYTKRNTSSTFLIPTSQRPLRFNAIFTKNTSPSRQRLAEHLLHAANNPPPPHIQHQSLNAFINIAETWNMDMNPNETIHPTQYVEILSQSQFTLSPTGHNPECFRHYEAVLMGSIPIVSMDQEYQTHPCPNALLPFVQKHWHASNENQYDGNNHDWPFVVLDNWTMLESTLDHLFFKPGGRPATPWQTAQLLDAFQDRILQWYPTHMRHYVRSMEDKLVDYARRYKMIKAMNATHRQEDEDEDEDDNDDF